MFNKRRDKRAAFTLIELLAALAVLSLLVMMLFMAFSNANRMMTLGSNQMEKNQAVRAVLQQIARDLERTYYSTTGAAIYASAPVPYLFTGTSSAISTQSLYCLSTLAADEGLLSNVVVNVGYGIQQVLATTYGVTVSKWSIQRGDDPTNAVPPVDWTGALTGTAYTPPSGFWKTLSDNIVGIAFQFYTNYDGVPLTSWGGTTNALPTSIGITIWAIDSANYNLALKLDSTLGSDPAKTIFTNNLHQYTSRVFLPQSTQN